MVKCKYCGAGTEMEGTRLCDQCWELSSRIERASDDVLVKILEDVKGDLIPKKKPPEVHQLEELRKSEARKSKELIYEQQKKRYVEKEKGKASADKTLRRNVNVLRKSYAYHVPGKGPGISESLLCNDFYERVEREPIVDRQFIETFNHLIRTGEAKIVMVTAEGDRIIRMRRPA